MSVTLDYYNTEAKQFSEDTVNIDFTEVQDKFLNLLPPKADILDFGCGAGRDSKYFLEKGYIVEAIDGSEELCKLAIDYTGIEVKQMLFQELETINKYDGIWACASILHLKKSELISILHKMSNALKNHGIIYTSFKYGEFEGESNRRYFTNMTEESFMKILGNIPELKIEEQWITSDKRPNRGEEKWLNLMLRK